MLLVLLATLHLFLVPRIEAARPWLERQAAQALGAPLHIGALHARSQWLGVEVSAIDVCLPDAAAPGGCALHAPRAVVALSLPSLLRARTVQLALEQPQLSLRRTAQGRWRLAGIDLAASGAPGKGADGAQAALDWVFSQPEWAVLGATLHIADEQGSGAPVTLRVPQLVLRNDAFGRHDVLLDAVPANASLGGALSLHARLRSPPLARHPGRWQEWGGLLYVQIERLNGAQLAQRLALPAGWQWRSGSGALRLWSQIRSGAPASATVDVALRGVDATLGAQLAPLALETLGARVHWQHEGRAHSLTVQRLYLDSIDSIAGIEGGHLHIVWMSIKGGTLHSAQAHARQLDAGALLAIAQRLPLPAAAAQVRTRLAALGVRGRVQDAQLDWQGASQWTLHAQLGGVAVAAQPAAKAAEAGIPGIAGADVQLSATHSGGRARLSIRQGALEFPGVFEEPRIPVDALDAAVRWSVRAATGDAPLHLAIEVPELTLKNADTTGRFAGGWRSYDAQQAKAAGGSPWPGVLTLEGTFARANGARVHRYLPLAIPAQARRYVREAIREGQAHDWRVRIKGDARHLGDAHPPRGTEFLFSGQVRDVVMDYVPAFLLPKGQPAWPALRKLSGTLSFEHARMRVTDASAEVQGHAGWRFTQIHTEIPNLTDPTVRVRAAGSGALAAALGIVRASPAAILTSHAMDDFKAEGRAALALELDLPTSRLHASRVRGAVTLEGNTLRLAAAAPPLTQARGTVQFSETGFTLEGVRAQALGGEVSASGGMDAKGIAVTVAGSASAQALHAMRSAWGPAAALAQHASGSMAYELALSFAHGPVPALRIHSDLHGMALTLPAPLAKSAAERRLLHVHWQPGSAGGGQLEVQLGQQLALRYAAPAAKGAAARGVLALGQAVQSQAQHLPREGLHLAVDVPQLDVQQWAALLPVQPAAERSTSGSGKHSAALPDVLPDVFTVRAGELRAAGHTLHRVQLQGTRMGQSWRASVQAQQTQGYLRYRSGSGDADAGSFRAQLERLHLTMPDASATSAQGEENTPGRHRRLPALDVHVDDLRLNSRALGQLALRASQQAQHWRIDTLRLRTPEATLTASGQWRAARGHGSRLAFALALRDAGALLTRFAMPGTLAGGSGSITGQLHWDGAPWQPHWPSMGGELALRLGAGQFLKADPGIAKLLGVLSLQALPRRLALDFRDIFSAGFAFDAISGEVAISDGAASTRDLRMSGTQALVAMEGSVNLAHETQNLRVLVVPQLDAGAAALAATAINPVAGISAFLAQLVLQKPLSRAASRQFAITGTWGQPHVTPLPASHNTPDTSTPESTTP